MTDQRVALRTEGLALMAQLSQAPTDNEVVLQQATEKLSTAFELGDHTPETVWALYRALLGASHFADALSLLKRYVELAPDREEEFLARHYIVDACSIWRHSEEAVEWHRHLYHQMRGRISAERLLWSFADSTMMDSWRACGLLTEWLDISQDLYTQVEDTAATSETRGIYLATLSFAIYFPAGEDEKAAQACFALIDLTIQYQEHWMAARWFFCDAQGMLLSLYHRKGEKTLEKQAYLAGKQCLQDYQQYIDDLKAKGDEKAGGHGYFYGVAMHNFACQCLWNGYATDAVMLFERTLANTDTPESSKGPTHFFLAAAILQATSDRQASLNYLKLAMANPFFSRKHELRRAFLEESAFEAAWNDEYFLAFIDSVEHTL